jgi:predicted nucleotidyltransferase
MSNTYRVSFKQLQQENLKDTFAAFQKALKVLDIDCYIIGALARDTRFAQKGKRALGTKDVDFAILVLDAKNYQELKEYLIKEEGFRESKINKYSLFDQQGQQIDLLPFGAIEIEDNQFIDAAGVIHADVSGFKEVYEAATEEVSFEGGYNFKVSTLAGITILKLLAFDNQPEVRSKDIRDIGAILTYYFELESDMIYDRHSDLFSKEDRTLEEITARVLGREMQAVLNRSAILKERVLTILTKDTASIEESVIGRLLVPIMNLNPTSIEETVNLLKEIIEGITDEF